MKNKLKKLFKIKLGTVTLLAVFFFVSIFAHRAHEKYLYKIKGKSVIKLYKRNKGSGTGFAVQGASGNKYIMTNKHICEHLPSDSDSIDIDWKNYQGKFGKAEVVYKDDKMDLCLLSSAEDIPTLGIADEVSPQDKVALLGYPGGRGLTFEVGYFIEQRKVKLLDECFLMWEKEKCYRDYTSKHINVVAYPGNSGSPVLNIYGNVVGVLFAGSPSQATATYIVPLEHVKRVLQRN